MDITFKDLLVFMSGVGVTVIVYFLQKKQSKYSDDHVTIEADNTRNTIQLLEKRVLDLIDNTISNEEEKQSIRRLFDEAVFEEIISKIDPQSSLKKQEEEFSIVLTKKLLFYLVRNTVPFSFEDYQRLILWLIVQGYYFPKELQFQSHDSFNTAISRIERFNKQGYYIRDVEINELFGSE